MAFSRGFSLYFVLYALVSFPEMLAAILMLAARVLSQCRQQGWAWLSDCPATSLSKKLLLTAAVSQQAGVYLPAPQLHCQFQLKAVPPPGLWLGGVFCH